MTTRTGNDIGSNDALARALEAAGRGVVVADLGSVELVRLEGRDARRFCNGMFTNNARDLPVGGTQRSAIVDDRGRIGGFLDLQCHADHTFVAVLDGLDAAAFLARFEKYVVFDDVALTPHAARLTTAQGPSAADALRAAGLAVPEPGRFVSPAGPIPGSTAYASRRSPAGGFDILDGPPDLVATVPADGIEVLRVLAGRPTFPADTGDKRLPQELGLREEMLSFDKGCYLGQETIHRLDVMGQVRKRLVGLRIDPSGREAPPPGARVSVGADAVGELTSPVPLPSGWAGLAVLRMPADVPGTRVRIDHGEREWDAVVSGFPIPAGPVP